MDINKLTAELCGVILHSDPEPNTVHWFNSDEGKEEFGFEPWNYRDPRCMVLIEAALELETERCGDDEWFAETMRGEHMSRANTPHLARTAAVEKWAEAQ